MRVTNKMMTDNLVYWLSKQTEALNKAAIIAATGKNVNDPSDDPLAAGEILNDLTTLSKYDQYQSNLEQAQTWIEASDTVLETVLDLLNEAQDAAYSQSSTDDDIKENAILTLSSLYDQILSYANEQYGDDYLYSGGASDTAPFSNESTVSGGSAEDIVFDLAASASNVTIEITDQDGTLVRTLMISGGTEGTNTVTWDGLDDGGGAVADGTYNYTVTATDSGGDSVASFPTYRGSDTDKTVIVGDGTVINLERNGGELFSDSLKAINEILAALQADTVDASKLSSGIDELDEAISDFQNQITKLAMANTRLETVGDTIEKAINTYENKLSGEQACDETEAATILQTLETNRDITIETISSILGMKNLASFL